MSYPRHHRLLLLLLLAACSTETTVVQVDVANVTVSPSPAAVEVGLSIQFTAAAVDPSGEPVTGQVVIWESGSPSVASIDDGGLATGVTEGTTEIRATVGGVTGTQTLTVDPSSCTTAMPVELAPGEYASFDGDECVLLPAGSAGDLYRVALTRPTQIYENAANVADVTLNISPVAIAVGPPVAAAPSERAAPAAALEQMQLPRLDAEPFLEGLRWMDATRAFHDELRLRERSLGLGSNALLPNAARAGAPPIARVDPPATDSMFLQVDCSAAPPAKPVTLIAFSDYLAVYQETTNYDVAPLSVAAADALIAYHDAYVRDMIREYWGPIPDTNADGRVTVVTNSNLDDNVAAAVFSGDFFPRSGGCPSSNERETIYFQADLLRYLDPARDTVNYFALGTLAHEMKHVVSLYNGIQRNAFQELWIEEGTAEVAQEMGSRYAWRANGGPAIGEQLTGSMVLDALRGGREREVWGLALNMADLARSLSAQPNSVVANPDGAPEGHSFYANSWLWHRFLGDAFGGGAAAMDSAFFRTLTDRNPPLLGVDKELQLTGKGSFEELFEDFVVALSLHGSGYAAPYPIDTWDLVTASSIFRTPNPPGVFPWPVTATEETEPDGSPISFQQWEPFTTNSYTGGIGPSGIRFHDFRSSGTVAAQISVRGLTQPCDGDNTMRCDRIIVTRLD